MTGRRGRTPLQRYREFIDQCGPDDCWPWKASTDKKGYGRFRVNGYTYRAHCWGYTALVGPTNGLHVLHRCDNPPCQNRRHWWLGTNGDNVADKVTKGRATGSPGATNPAAKLTPEQVAEIRFRHNGPRTHPTQVELAAEYGVHHSTIGRILRDQTWS